MIMERMTQNEKKLTKELYKAHFTAKETSAQLSYSYATIRNLYRGFDLLKVTKFNRYRLLPIKYTQMCKNLQTSRMAKNIAINDLTSTE